MRIVPLLFCCLLFFSTALRSQKLEYSILTLDKDLVANANAVVRLDRMDINIHASNKITYTVNEVVTVLNKLGRYQGANSIGYDKERKIKKLDVYVYDQMGTEIEHFKRKDFEDVSAADGFSLYSDDRVLRHAYTPVAYPYTIQTTYEVETSDTGFFPPWYFLSNYNVSVAESHYQISWDNPDLKPLIKEHNFTGFEHSKKEASSSVVYTAKDIPAMEYEQLSPSMKKTVPRLAVRMRRFNLKGETGEVEDWKDFGKWMDERLLRGMDELSPATIAKAKKLVEGVTDDLEKAKIIYDYVQGNTRYISVQVGIGGWKPISAIEVDRVKYGDCKGLSNYTKALLGAVGVQAYYTVIFAGERKTDFDEDFASLQGNHVILTIPYEGKDYWIDCTSQVHPFGFVGDFTDDRKALVITPEGGEIKRTVAYVDKDNTERTTGTATLDATGTLDAQLEIETTGISYDNRFGLERDTPKAVLEHYKEEWGHINNIKLGNTQFQNDEDGVRFLETLSLSADKYAITSGNRLFFRPNAFSVNAFVPKKYDERKRPVAVYRGYYEEADVVIGLPEGYRPEAIPEKVTLNNEFGTYRMQCTYNSEGNTIKYTRSLLVKKGIYPNHRYKDYRAFRKTVATTDQAQVVLLKQ